MADKGKNPSFDERALAKLLEAAYVVQEHNRQSRTPQPNPAEATAYKTEAVESSTLKSPVSSAGQSEARTSETQLAGDNSATPVLVAPSAEPETVILRPIASAPAPGIAPAPLLKGDYAAVLAQILETQREMQVRGPEREDAMTLIAERVVKIAKAGGAAIGIVEGENFRYRASAGLMTPSDAAALKEKALCIACLRTSQVVRCDDIDSEFLVDVEQCRARGIQSMIAVPVFHDGVVTGGVELYYATKRAFTEQDIHTAQLMAGLVTEALAREEERTWKKSLADERAVMLDALERLKPNLAALVDATAAMDAASRPTGAARGTSKGGVVCRKCGHQLLGEEQFCGKCGSPRSGGYEPPGMRTKVGSSWNMHDALRTATVPANGNAAVEKPAEGFDDAQFERMLADSLEKEMPELFQVSGARTDEAAPQSVEAAAGFPLEAVKEAAKSDAELNQEVPEEIIEEGEADFTPIMALAKPERVPDWSSAASAREFLEQLAAERSGSLARFWQARRGDFYLALAVILVAVVIRWGIWSNHPVGATGSPAIAAAQHRKPATDAGLSWFDRMLISLGLAEAPEQPEYKGNPQTQVWVDLQTALYYCPGAALYGKTPKGKFATQRDAQLDEYEPALRKACD